MRRPKVAQHGRDNRIFGSDPVPPGRWIYAGTFPGDSDTIDLSPPFQNDWANAGGGLQRLRFRLTNEDTLEIHGAVTGGTEGTVVITLPDVDARFRDSVFWPLETKYLVGSNGDDAAVIWKLEPNGDLTLVGTAGGGTSNTAGPGLTDTAGDFSVNVDGSTIEISSDTLRVKDGGITTAKLSFDPATQTELDAHVNDTTAAHAASAISADSTTLVGTATNVQGVLEELDDAIAGISGGGGNFVSTDVIWDAKGDIAGGTGSNAADNLAVGTNGQVLIADSAETTGLKWGPGYLGGLELVYKYRCSSAKASIDTGADTAQAGTNDWTGGDVLEIFIVARSADAGAVGTLVMVVNNDTGSATYDRSFILDTNATLSGGVSLAQTTGWLLTIHGNGGAASYASSYACAVPFYAATDFYKSMVILDSTLDATAGNVRLAGRGQVWKNTAAITRLAISVSGGANLQTGTTLIIYKRRNA